MGIRDPFPTFSGHGVIFRCSRLTHAPLCTLLHNHLDCPFGTDRGADAAALAVIQIEQHLPCPLIPGDAEIRAEKSAEVTGFTFPDPQASLSLLDCLLFRQTHLHRRETLLSTLQRQRSSFRTADFVLLTRLRHHLSSSHSVIRLLRY